MQNAPPFEPGHRFAARRSWLSLPWHDFPALWHLPLVECLYWQMRIFVLPSSLCLIICLLWAVGSNPSIQRPSSWPAAEQKSWSLISLQGRVPVPQLWQDHPPLGFWHLLFVSHPLPWYANDVSSESVHLWYAPDLWPPAPSRGFQAATDDQAWPCRGGCPALLRVFYGIQADAWLWIVRLEVARC